MRTPKNVLLFFFTLLVVVACIFVVVFFVFQKGRKVPQIQNNTIPTPTPFQQESLLKRRDKPLVRYLPGTGEKLVDLMDNKRDLSKNDAVSRNRLSQEANNEGVVFENEMYRVWYIKSFEMIQIEILSKDIQASKEAATKWLEEQGLSKEGICDIPVMFYLGSDAIDVLPTEGIDFNPLPDGC